MAVDKNNHIWVLQRPSSNVKDDLGLDEKVSMCCTSAPSGAGIRWPGQPGQIVGGPGNGYEWPATEHSIFVDQIGDVWITGNGAKDRQAIKFTNDGKFILEIGHPSAAAMDNADSTMLERPAGIEVDERLMRSTSATDT